MVSIALLLAAVGLLLGLAFVQQVVPAEPFGPPVHNTCIPNEPCAYLAWLRPAFRQPTVSGASLLGSQPLLIAVMVASSLGVLLNIGRLRWQRRMTAAVSLLAAVLLAVACLGLTTSNLALLDSLTLIAPAPGFWVSEGLLVAAGLLNVPMARWAHPPRTQAHRALPVTR
jgi:hypothetical protein